MNKLWLSLLVIVLAPVAQADLWGSSGSLEPNYCNGSQAASGTPTNPAFQAILNSMCQSGDAMRQVILQNQGGSGGDATNSTFKNLTQMILGRKPAANPAVVAPIAPAPATTENNSTASAAPAQSNAGIYGHA